MKKINIFLISRGGGETQPNGIRVKGNNRVLSYKVSRRIDLNSVIKQIYYERAE